MFNLRVNVMAAGAAFILSFLIGMITGSTMPMLIIRPFIFAAVFFIIFAVIQVLINRFLPELFEGGGSRESVDFFPGSRVDITEGDTDSPTPSYSSNLSFRNIAGARPDDTDKEVEDISQLGTRSKSENIEELQGIDQNRESSYTEGGDVEDLPKFDEVPIASTAKTAAPAKADPPAAKKPAASDSELGDFFFPDSTAASSSDEVLPDLDSMAGAFSSASYNEEGAASDFSAPSTLRKASSNDDSGWAGDYPPKDMASGLRTVLTKDKEA